MRYGRSLALSGHSHSVLNPTVVFRSNGRRNHQQGENYTQAQPEPAYDFDQRITW